ncbi:MAG: hypothetical protein DRP91_09765 [Candidatus Neomarinimicrobiota bacterium]|nr:MAG: hypothetical protein DRP91_09765 [Candidatus Neomarinimicrobiota bacterium]
MRLKLLKWIIFYFVFNLSLVTAKSNHFGIEFGGNCFRKTERVGFKVYKGDRDLPGKSGNYKKGLSIGIQYRRLFMFPPYKSALWGKGNLIGCNLYYSLPGNFVGSFGCLYTPKISAEYLLVHPMDRVYHLSNLVLTRGRIYYPIQFLSLRYGTPYISAGFILLKATNVVDFLGNKKYHNELPLQIGGLYSIGVEFNIWGSLSIPIEVGIQKLRVKKKGLLLYSLDGITFQVMFKWNLTDVRRRLK